MKTPTKSAPSKGGQPLPPGAHRVPGARQIEAEKGAPVKEPKTLDHRKVTDPHGVRVKDNRTIDRR